jgi:transposase
MGSYTYLKSSNGTTYVYWQVAQWDSEKGMSVPQKTCVGKVGADGEIIYNKRFSAEGALSAFQSGYEEVDSVSIGQSMLLDYALLKSGLSVTLPSIFGDDLSSRIISIAYAIVAGDSRMYCAGDWMAAHECPCHNSPLASPRISETFAGITPSMQESFIAKWVSNIVCPAAGYYCFDLTSVSSTNEDNPFVELGYNRDKEKLPQINIALLSGVSSCLPVAYQMLPGSVSDVTCVQEIGERMSRYGINGIRMILDKGFYSLPNVEDMLGAGWKFMMPVPRNVLEAQNLIDSCRNDIESDLHFVHVEDDGTNAIYGMTVLGKIGGKRIWQHVYLDTARRMDHISKFFAKLSVWEDELKQQKPKKANKAYYAKYFIVKNTPKRGYKVKRNMTAINEYKTDYSGYWIIITNFEKDAVSALSLYRQRQRVEQHYDDLKNELDMMRLRTHRQETMSGRIFTHFIALIILQQLRLIMEESGLTKKMRNLSVRTMLNKVSPYSRIHFKGKYKDIYSTMTKSQRTIFTAFGLLKKS